MTARMSDLAVHIDEFAMQDGRLAECLSWIINQHIQGHIKYEDLPQEAKLCYGLYEQEKTLYADADAQADQWEKEHKIDIHNKINWAVKNGQLDHDQGMELINNPERAEEWAEKGVF